MLQAYLGKVGGKLYLWSRNTERAHPATVQVVVHWLEDSGDARTLLDQSKGFVFSRMDLCILFAGWFLSLLSKASWRKTELWSTLLIAISLVSVWHIIRALWLISEQICKRMGASQMALVVKNLSARAEDVRDAGLIPGLERWKDWRTHSRILAWRIPMDRGAWQAIVHRVVESWTWLKRLSTTHT